MLALEVLSKLPEVVDMSGELTRSYSVNSASESTQIQTGTLDTKPSGDSSDTTDWSKPVMNGSAFSNDWSQPVISTKTDTSSSAGFDWSQPVSKVDDDELKLDWGDDDGASDTSNADADTKSDNDAEIGDAMTSSKHNEQQPEELNLDESVSKSKAGGAGDIMAQQLKFIACLKVMMEELSTLATGFEVDGGQLRFQLYIWLEKEVEVLKQLTNYGRGVETSSSPPHDVTRSGEDAPTDGCLNSLGLDTSSSKPTLHEVILAEKLDFEKKVVRARRRKQWLKAHQQLLRTLLGYCVLHGAGGGGLSSVRMELILLLQELQQERTQQQLLSPLPFPTTLPLLSASVASSKTVIADPIRHLQVTPYTYTYVLSVGNVA